jgi:hypothetical protein
MAKLITFDGDKGETVWINPGHATLVEQVEPGRAVVYFSGGNLSPVFLKGEAGQIAARLNQHMGWWW